MRRSAVVARRAADGDVCRSGQPAAHQARRLRLRCRPRPVVPHPGCRQRKRARGAVVKIDRPAEFADRQCHYPPRGHSRVSLRSTAGQGPSQLQPRASGDHDQACSQHDRRSRASGTPWLHPRRAAGVDGARAPHHESVRPGVPDCGGHPAYAAGNRRERSAGPLDQHRAVRGDLTKRTFRQREDADTVVSGSLAAPLRDLVDFANRNALGIVPLHPDYYFRSGDPASSPPDPSQQYNVPRTVDGERERGYFYISEGDPFDDTDDVLQFTIDATQTDLGNENKTPYPGRARPLGVTWNGPCDPLGTMMPNSPVNRDQPIWDDRLGTTEDFDDCDLDGNPDDDGDGDPADAASYGPFDTGTSESDYAEVSYFLRNGVLYRRVLLIRDPEFPEGGGVKHNRCVNCLRLGRLLVSRTTTPRTSPRPHLRRVCRDQTSGTTSTLPPRATRLRCQRGGIALPQCPAGSGQHRRQPEFA